MDNKIIVCACGNPSHQIIFTDWGDDDIGISVHLTKLSLWERIKYVFTGYPRFEEIVTTRDRLKETLLSQL